MVVGGVLRYLRVCDAVGRVAGAVAALLSSSLPTLEPTDFLQHREAARGPAAGLRGAPVVMDTGGDVAVRSGALLDLGKGELQASQGVFSVRVELSLPRLALRSCRLADETEGRRLRGGGGRSMKRRAARVLRLGQQGGPRGLRTAAVLLRRSKGGGKWESNVWTCSSAIPRRQ